MSTQDRKNSLGQVATGATLFGAGMGGSHLLDERLKRKKAKGPIRATANSLRRKPGGFKARTHLPHVAGKLGARGLQAVGLPLAAYGAANAVRPKPKPTERLDPRAVSRDVVRHATLQDQVSLGEDIYGRPVRKALKVIPRTRGIAVRRPDGTVKFKEAPIPPTRAEVRAAAKEAGFRNSAGRARKITTDDVADAVDAATPAAPGMLGAGTYGRGAYGLSRMKVSKALSERERRSLDRHRAVGRTLSLASGTMGLTALGLRAPAAAKVAVKQGAKHGRLVRLAAKEQAATAHSNTLGVAAIGTGSAGSFNYAAQQKLERKKDTVAKGKGKLGAKLVGDVAERLTHTRLPASARVRRPPVKSAQPDPRKSLRERVTAWGDRRAENLMDEIVPWDYETSQGVRRGQATIATSRDGSGKAVVHLGGKERRIPLARQVQVPLERQGPRGGKHDVGYVNAVVWPTKHVNISGMKIRQSEKGRGTGTELLNTSLANIRRAKTPGMVWQAGEYKEDVGRAVPKGVTMWRKPGIDYLPGMPVAPGSARRLKNPPSGKPATPGEARAQAWAQMNSTERREVRSHTRAARTGRAKPTDVAAMSPNSQRYMSDQPWYARVPGGEPFLGRTRRAAAGATVAGGAAYGGNRWEEHKHPRGYGGTFRSKGGVSKGLPKRIFHAGKSRRVLHYDPVKGLIRLDGDYVIRRGGAKPPKEPKPPEQMTLPFGKAEREHDRFLRGYGTRISPDAERGYRTLKHGRNQQAAQAAGAATMAGLGGWLTHHEVTSRPRNKPAVAVTAASTLASAYTAGSNARGAHRYDRKMDKIKAKARSRRAQGLYGPGRGLTPVDDTSARARNLAKSMGAAR